MKESQVGQEIACLCLLNKAKCTIIRQRYITTIVSDKFICSTTGFYRSKRALRVVSKIWFRIVLYVERKTCLSLQVSPCLNSVSPRITRLSIWRHAWRFPNAKHCWTPRDQAVPVGIDVASFFVICPLQCFWPDTMPKPPTCNSKSQNGPLGCLGLAIGPWSLPSLLGLFRQAV